ncbi:MAG: Wzy polymerase domain-containing protein [Limnohabitans sp.]
MSRHIDRIPGWLAGLLLVLPWVHPWSPGPQPNTVPLLVGWGSLAVLLGLGHLPSALELARAWAWAALLSSAMGLLQYFGEAGHLGGWVHAPAWLGDAVGNLRQRNQLATLTSIGAVAVLWWHRQGLAMRHALWMLGVLALGNAATGSRTGLLQWLLLAALAALWQATSRPRRAAWSWPVLGWGLGVYLLASLLLPQALAAWQGATVNSAMARMGDVGGCGSRSVLWRNVLYLISQRPWTGWGWDEVKYAHYITTYPGERFCDILGHAHNLPLHLALTLGIPVATLLCLAMLGLLWRARPWRLSNPQASLAWGVLATLGVHSLLEYPLWYSPFQLALLWGLLLLWPSRGLWWPRHHQALQAAAAGALCLIALIAWDYERMRQIYLPAPLRQPLWRDDPWPAARQTWFFGRAVRFAEVTSTPVTQDNAPTMLAASLATLHYSPEPRVIDRLVQSARLAGQEDLARQHEAQRRAVYGSAPP